MIYFQFIKGIKTTNTQTTEAIETTKATTKTFRTQIECKQVLLATISHKFDVALLDRWFKKFNKRRCSCLERDSNECQHGRLDHVARKPFTT